MFLNWFLIFEHARKRPGARPEHPLSDPLERPEWQGLGWAVTLLSRGSRRRRGEKAATAEPSRDPVEGCYAPA